jgi:alkylhydroperoxidase/carboxymuconolactone decarboxylase family protein YurZ
MRWKTAALCALALAGTLGCPHAFGRGGTVDKATHKDVQEALDLGDCTEEEYRKYCVPDSTSETCRKECG